MKCEWKEVKLQDIALELSDGLHKAPIFYPDGEYIFVNATNIENGRIVEKDPSKKTNLEEFLKYGVELTDRTILYSIDGTIGNIAKYRGEKCLLGKGACYITLDDSVDVDYIYYLLQSPIFNEYIHIMSTGSTIRHISLKTMRNFTFQLPPIEHQKAIGNVLSSIDNKIEINNKINENLERQGAALVEQYIQSTNDTVTLSDIMSFDNGFAFKSTSYLSSGRYRIITIKNVQDGFIDSSGTAFIDSLPSKMKSCCILHVGDVLLSLTGNVGRVGIVCETDLLLNQRVAKFVPAKKELLPFLYFLFRQPCVVANLKSIAKGTAQLNLSPVETLTQKVPYEKKSAEAYSRILKNLYQTIISNNQQNISLIRLRNHLLPRLICGGIDVSI